MKIRILRNLGLGLPQYNEGQEIDLDDAAASDLVSKGLAEVVLRTVAVPSLTTSPPEPEPMHSAHHETKRRGRPPYSAGT